MATRISGTVPSAVTRPALDASASATNASTPDTVTSTESGIVVNDHPILRNVMRWGGLAAAVGGVGYLGYRAATVGGGIASIGSVAGPAAALAAVGVGALLLSFAVKPEIKPFLKGGIADFNSAVVEATSYHDDVAIYADPNGRYGIVDFRDRDFDNEPLDNIRLGNKNIPWAGLVTQDGDLLRQVDGSRYQDMGRAHPAAVRVSDLNPSTLGTLAGETIGTSNDHRVAKLGRPVGASAGYGTYAEAAKAAYDLAGDNAVVKVGARWYLFDAALPAGVGADFVAARGTGLSPVSALEVQEGKKLYRATSPGQGFDFVSRAIPFSPSEPIGYGVGAHTIDRLVQSFSRRGDAVSAMPASPYMVDAVWEGRIDGFAVLRGSGPGVADSFHLYQYGYRPSIGQWDRELARVEATLQRERDSRVEYNQIGSTEYDATVYRDTFSRTQVVLHDTGATGDHVLRTTGWQMVGHDIDWMRTNQLRDRLHRERVDRENGSGTSPGDDTGGSSGTSPGDDTGGSSGSSGTSPGDDTGGSSGSSGSSPGDDTGGSSGSSGSSPGDDSGSSSGSSDTSPSDDSGSGSGSSGTSSGDD